MGFIFNFDNFKKLLFPLFFLEPFFSVVDFVFANGVYYDAYAESHEKVVEENANRNSYGKQRFMRNEHVGEN